MSIPKNADRTNWESIWKNEFLELFHNHQLKTGLIIATQEYIPIEHFKVAFLKAADFAKEKQWEAFVFDKTALTTFHQPSMEWYYTHWKKGLLEHDLRMHYKILPAMAWFKTSVDAGLAELKANNPDFDFSQFEVKYIDSVDEIKG